MGRAGPRCSAHHQPIGPTLSTFEAEIDQKPLHCVKIGTRKHDKGEILRLGNGRSGALQPGVGGNHRGASCLQGERIAQPAKPPARRIGLEGIGDKAIGPDNGDPALPDLPGQRRVFDIHKASAKPGQHRQIIRMKRMGRINPGADHRPAAAHQLVQRDAIDGRLHQHPARLAHGRTHRSFRQAWPGQQAALVNMAGVTRHGAHPRHRQIPQTRTPAARRHDGCAELDREIGHRLNVRAAFGLVSVEQRITRNPAPHQIELPGKVMRIAQAPVQALACKGRIDVRGIARQQHAPFAKAVGIAGVEGVDDGAFEGGVILRRIAFDKSAHSVLALQLRRVFAGHHEKLPAPAPA